MNYATEKKLLPNLLLLVALFAVPVITGCNSSLVSSLSGGSSRKSAISASHSSIAASLLTVQADGTTSSKVTLKIADSNGKPIVGEPVQLASSRGIQDTFTPSSALTDANGNASFAATSSIAGSAVLSYVDLIDSSTFSAGVTLKYVSANADSGSSILTVVPSSVAADGGTYATITVIVNDQNALPISNRTILLKSSRNTAVSGVLPSVDVISAASGPSDLKGIVTFTVNSKQTGTAQLTAYDASSGSAVAGGTVTFIASPVSQTLSTISTNVSNVTADGTSVGVVTVVLVDTSNKVMSGKIVQLSSSRGGSDNLTPTTVQTDTNGSAVFKVSSTVLGSTTLTAIDITDAVILRNTASLSFLSGDATLSALSLSSGSLSPSFASGTTSYTVTVPYVVSSMIVTPTVNQANATVLVNGVSASSPLGLSVGSNTIATVVTAQNGTTQSYIITVTRVAPATDATLSALTLSSGSLSPSFASGTTSYTVSVPYTVSSMTVTPTVNQVFATVLVNLAPASSPVALSVGSNMITTLVTAENGTTKAYIITVTRSVPATDATLSALVPSIGSLSPSFASATTSYTVSVTYLSSNISFQPTVNQVDATVQVSGASFSYGWYQASLSVGANPIIIVVTAQNGTTKTYTVTVTRAAVSTDATLSALTLNSGVMVPSFTSGTLTYSSFIPGVTSVTVTPTQNNQYATVTVNGATVTSGSPSSSITMVDGLNTITVLVTAQDGVTTQTYTLSAYSNQAIVTTFAGSTKGYLDGTGTAAQFGGTSYGTFGKSALDSSGNLIVPDTGSHVIRKVTPSGVVTTLAGSLAQTWGSANGTGTAATFYAPKSVAVDSSGNIYVADTNNYKIRKVTPAGVVTTLAGSGTQVSTNGTGTAAAFVGPIDVICDSSNNVFVVDGSSNQRVRKITPAGVVTTFAGSGAGTISDGTGVAASFLNITSMAIDSSNNIFLADSYSIRKMTAAGVVTTIAGSGYATGSADGTGTAATFGNVNVGSVDPSGNVYVGDTTNSLIRRVSPSGVVTTMVGTAAQFVNPIGPVVDSVGNLYVPDQSTYLIRLVK